MSGALGRPWGRTRQRLAKLLEDAGCTVTLLSAAQGRERSDPMMDIYRWEAAVRYGHDRYLSSYDTMTDCVKYGIEIDWTNEEVYAKKR